MLPRRNMPAMHRTASPRSDQRLTIIPSVPVWWVDGQVVFDRKFYDGLAYYIGAWNGRVRLLARRATTALPAFGAVHVDAAQLPCELVLLGGTELAGPAHLADTTVVMAAADDHTQLHLGALCRSLGIRCVYVIEMIPETRHQMNRLDALNTLVRWRRDLFLRQTERARRAAFRACDGLQANGLPAHDAYQSHGNCLLYFDTRVGRHALIDDRMLAARLAQLYLPKPRPLRLAFSGRLIAMKGADHLVAVAARLQARGVHCEWTVYGTGDLEATMRADIARLGLADNFKLAGAVDFDATLIPAIQSNCDLYVMLHRQSDPSCTYLETLACGIPIVGYANRSLAGLLRRANVGEQVPIDDIDQVVEVLARLDVDRPAIARMSRAARAFAEAHAFEDTFQRRVEHLQQVASAA
jgi:glycosyltransferase involved in cell wall biosynthesis